eukprot:349990-Chlamydomonas_euryale.AAC.8
MHTVPHPSLLGASRYRLVVSQSYRERTHERYACEARRPKDMLGMIFLCAVPIMLKRECQSGMARLGRPHFFDRPHAGGSRRQHRSRDQIDTALLCPRLSATVPPSLPSPAPTPAAMSLSAAATGEPPVACIAYVSNKATRAERPGCAARAGLPFQSPRPHLVAARFDAARWGGLAGSDGVLPSRPPAAQASRECGGASETRMREGHRTNDGQDEIRGSAREMLRRAPSPLGSPP